MSVLIVSFVILAAAVALGTGLAVLYLRDKQASAAPWPVAGLHAAFGLVGLGCLILSLVLSVDGPVRGAELGVASFGAVAAVLLAMAAVAGAGVLVTYRLGRRTGGALIAMHAVLAVSGFVVLAAYVLA